MGANEAPWLPIDDRSLKRELALERKNYRQKINGKLCECLNKHLRFRRDTGGIVPDAFVELPVSKYICLELETWAEVLYHAHLFALSKRGRNKTPDFLIGTLTGAVLPGIERELQWTLASLRRTEQTYGVSSRPREDVETFARKLKTQWRERVKSELADLEATQTSKVHEATVAEDVKFKSRRGRKCGKRFRETVVLDDAIRRAKEDLAREGGDAHSTTEIARKLAKSSLAPPSPRGWHEKYGVKSWGDVLRNAKVRKLAAKRFSKVKPSL